MSEKNGNHSSHLMQAQQDLAYITRLLSILDATASNFPIAHAAPNDQVKNPAFCCGLITGLRLMAKAITPQAIISNKTMKATLEYCLAQVHDANPDIFKITKENPLIEQGKSHAEPTAEKP